MIPITPAPDFRPGDRVVLARPEDPCHLRRGLTGVVRETSWHAPAAPRPRDGREAPPAPPPRQFLWVDFPSCPLNRDKPFGSPLWAEEVDRLPLTPAQV